MTVNAYTDTGRAYGAGIVAASNRLTIVNVYSLGDVYGGSSSSNMTFLGGIDGMEGGVHLNCYSSGNITSSKATSGIGAINGLVGGISLNKACYYNSDSTLTAAGSPAEMKASGANYSNVTDEAFPKTYAEITGEEFAQLLNTNAAGISQLLDEVRQGLDLERHALYYTGDGSDLARWAVIDGAVRFVFRNRDGGFVLRYDFHLRADELRRRVFAEQELRSSSAGRPVNQTADRQQGGNPFVPQTGDHRMQLTLPFVRI